METPKWAAVNGMVVGSCLISQRCVGHWNMSSTPPTLPTSSCAVVMLGAVTTQDKMTAIFFSMQQLNNLIHILLKTLCPFSYMISFESLTVLKKSAASSFLTIHSLSPTYSFMSVPHDACYSCFMCSETHLCFSLAGKAGWIGESGSPSISPHGREREREREREGGVASELGGHHFRHATGEVIHDASTTSII